MEVVKALTRTRQRRIVDRFGWLYSYFDAHPTVEVRVNYLRHPELIGVPGTFWFVGFGYFLGVTFSALRLASRSFQVFLPALATLNFDNSLELTNYIARNAPA